MLVMVMMMRMMMLADYVIDAGHCDDLESDGADDVDVDGRWLQRS